MPLLNVEVKTFIEDIEILLGFILLWFMEFNLDLESGNCVKAEIFVEEMEIFLPFLRFVLKRDWMHFLFSVDKNEFFDLLVLWKISLFGLSGTEEGF